jgi:hypothetical protein
VRLQIHLAAQSDQPDVVKLFLEKQPSLVTTATKVGLVAVVVCELHCKKRLTIFSAPAGMSLTKLSLAGHNLIISGQREFDK